MSAATQARRRTRWTAPRPEPLELPAGLNVPGCDMVATRRPHPDCPCVVCRATYAAWRAGTLDLDSGGWP